MNSNAYAPPKAPVADIDPAEGLVLAGRGMRLLAVIIDGIITMIFVYVPLLVSGDVQRAAAAARLNPDDPTAFYQAFFGLGGLLALIGFAVWCAITYVLVQRNGQTIAKKLLNIKVVRSDGSKASVARIFWLRNVVNALLGIIPFYGIVDVLFIFGERRQCLHDKIADTIVVNA
jgi:uncharacterized RDD family membrane protein YckC